MDLSKLQAKAKDSADRRNYELAVELYHQILDLDPTSLPDHKNLRAVSIQRGNQDPSIAKSAAFKGIGLQFKMLIAGKNSEKGLLAAFRFLSMKPNASGTLEKAAKFARDMEAFSVSVFYYQELKKIKGAKDIKVLFPLSAVMIEQGLSEKSKEIFDEGLEILTQVTEIDRTQREASTLLKDMLAKSQTVFVWDQEGIGKEGGYKDMLKDKKQSDNAAQDISGPIKNQQQLERVLRFIDDKIEKAPDTQRKIGLIISKGDKCREIKKYDQAKVFYKEALELDSSNAQLKIKIGDLELDALRDKAARLKVSWFKDKENKDKKREWQKAELAKNTVGIKQFEAKVDSRPTDMGFKFQLGKYLFDSFSLTKKEEFLNKAIAQFQKTINDANKRQLSHEYLGRCFMGQKDYDLAKDQFKKAAEFIEIFNEKAMGIVYNLGLSEEKVGNAEEAIRQYKKIIEVNIGYKDVKKRHDALRNALKK